MELRVDDREHGGRDGAAAEALDGAVKDHLVEAGGGGAQRARRGEAERRAAEHHTRRHHPRQRSGHRHHHHVGDQIGGLHPADFIGAGGQPALDLEQRAGDDLNIHDRHELADNHRQHADPVAQGRRRDRAGPGRKPAPQPAASARQGGGRGPRTRRNGEASVQVTCRPAGFRPVPCRRWRRRPPHRRARGCRPTPSPRDRAAAARRAGCPPAARCALARAGRFW